MRSNPITTETDIREAELCLIAGNAVIDGFMHAGGVFEPFKRLGSAQRFTLTLAPHVELPTLIDKARKSAHESGLVVSAVFFAGTSIGWFDPAVKLVSDGEMFVPLATLMLGHGWMGELPT